MIEGVINGYYRSGTTAIQRLCEVCTNSIVIHEPTNHEIVRHICAEGWNNKSGLHGFPIFRGYSQLEPHIFDEFVRVHSKVFSKKRNWGIITSEEDAIKILKPFHKSKLPVIIKSTQLSLFLDAIADEYDCWVIHTYRDVCDTVYNHFTCVRDYILYANSIRMNVPFYADLVFRNLAMGDYRDVKSSVDMIIYNVVMCDSIAEGSNAVTIHFDSFVRNPMEYIKELPFLIEERCIEKILTPDKLNPAPDKVREDVEKKIKRLFD